MKTTISALRALVREALLREAADRSTARRYIDALVKLSHVDTDLPDEEYEEANEAAQEEFSAAMDDVMRAFGAGSSSYLSQAKLGALQDLLLSAAESDDEVKLVMASMRGHGDFAAGMESGGGPEAAAARSAIRGAEKKAVKAPRKPSGPLH